MKTRLLVVLLLFAAYCFKAVAQDGVTADDRQKLLGAARRGVEEALGGTLAGKLFSSESSNVLTASLPVGETSGNSQTEWRSFTSTEGGFSILLPGPPHEFFTNANGLSEGFLLPKGQPYEGVNFLLVFQDLSRVPSKRESGELLNYFADGFLRSSVLRTEQPVNVDGGYGKEWVFDDPKIPSCTWLRVYLVKQRLYRLICWFTAAGPELPDAATKFVESFQFAGDKSRSSNPKLEKARPASASGTAKKTKQTPSDIGKALVGGPWQIRILSIADANSFLGDSSSKAKRVEPIRPDHKILVIKVRGNRTRDFNRAEKNVLSSNGQINLIVQSTKQLSQVEGLQHSDTFLGSQSFFSLYLDEMANKTRPVFSVCPLLIPGKGFAAVRVGLDILDMGFAAENEVEASIAFSYPAKAKRLILLFDPFQVSSQSAAALLSLKDDGNWAVEYGQYDQLRDRLAGTTSIQ